LFSADLYLLLFSFILESYLIITHIYVCLCVCRRSGCNKRRVFQTTSWVQTTPT